MKNEELYKKYLDGRHWEQHPTLYAERFADFLGKRLFVGALADFGCGTGRDVSLFTQRGINAIGIDISEKEIRSATAQHPQCTFLQEDIERLNLPDRCFGACFMINVIHYVDQEPALGEVMRTLGRGGFFFIHFNLSITDSRGHCDYRDEEECIRNKLVGWKTLERHTFTRRDSVPFPHTHDVLELILQKQ